MRSLLFALAALALASGAVAQYDEECHYECITVYCDPYEDYCDYDCHEVCYPYRKSVQADQAASKTTGPLGAPIKGGPPARAPQRASPIRTHDPESDMRARTGKVVRMRMHNPSTGRAQRVKGEAGRTSPVQSRFALFQSCLSESRTKSAGKV